MGQLEEEEAGSCIIGNVPVSECPDLRVWDSHVPLKDVRHLKYREKKVPRTAFAQPALGSAECPRVS